VKKAHLRDTQVAPKQVQTAGVDHLALIRTKLDRTIELYTEVFGMRLTRIIDNRDEPTSTHIFYEMGSDNQFAFFDFPEKVSGCTVRGIGSMHHIALKTRPEQMRAIRGKLAERHIRSSIHGTPDAGSIYVCDPDEILIELTTVTRRMPIGTSQNLVWYCNPANL
jgi:catechol 2,3-dioxygenase-like lactoylglutathione lyase family enzyme